MSGDLLDSNVFIYLFGPVTEKRERAEAVVRRALDADATISFQVVQETLNVILRGFTPAATPDEARRLTVSVLQPLWKVMPSVALYMHAMDLRARYGYAFYDSTIIAAALEAGCDRLLTEDMQDGQRMEGLTIVNPFG